MYSLYEQKITYLSCLFTFERYRDVSEGSDSMVKKVLMYFRSRDLQLTNQV